MNIVVLVKQVPDTWAERKLKDSDKTLDRASVDVVMNEIDEYAVEEALRIKEADGGEVTGRQGPPPWRSPSNWTRTTQDGGRRAT